MKKNCKVAGAVAVLFGFGALAISPVVQGPPPFPDGDSGGNIAQGPPPFPDGDSGGNIIAHGPWPFPDDSAGGNIVA
jgi:hypothetical protein